MILLKCLMRNANEVVSRTTLIERTHGDYSAEGSNRTDVYIRRLRKKIEANAPTQGQVIFTRYGGWGISSAVSGCKRSLPDSTSGCENGELLSCPTWRIAMSSGKNDHLVSVNGLHRTHLRVHCPSIQSFRDITRARFPRVLPGSLRKTDGEMNRRCLECNQRPHGCGPWRY